MDKKQAVQDPFLNAMRKERIPLSIFLVNGIKLQGTIVSFDQFTIMLKTCHHTSRLQTCDLHCRTIAQCARSLRGYCWEREVALLSRCPLVGERISSVI